MAAPMKVGASWLFGRRLSSIMISLKAQKPLQTYSRIKHLMNQQKRTFRLCTSKF